MSETPRVRMMLWENVDGVNVQIVDFNSGVVSVSEAENMISRMAGMMERHHKMHFHYEFDVVTVGTKWFTDDSNSKWGVILIFDGDKK